MSLLINAVVDSDLDLQRKMWYIQQHEKSAGFDVLTEKEAGAFVGKIKTLLSKSKTKCEGLFLLRSYIKNCRRHEFGDETVTWIKLCIDVVKKNDNSGKMVSADILVELFKLTRNSQDICQEIAKNALSSLIDAICGNKEACCLSKYCSLLNCCIDVFPGPCGPKRSVIEKFIFLQFEHIEKLDSEQILMLSDCLSKLPSCGGGGSKNQSHAAAWTSQIARVIVTLNCMLDRLYELAGRDSTNFHFENLNVAPWILVQQDNALNEILSIVKHFELFSHVICNMITNPFPSAISIPVPLLLNLTNKILSINCVNVASQTSVEAATVSSIIPTIHTSALQILESLVSVLGSNAVIHLNQVNDLLCRTLKWTHLDSKKITPYNENMYYNLKQTCYAVFIKWCCALGPCINFNNQHVETLLTCFKLNISSERSDPVKVSTEKHSCLVQSTLKALTSWLKVFASHITSNQYDDLAKFVIYEIFSVYRKGSALNESNRKDLLLVLRALVFGYPADISPPIALAFNVFCQAQSLEKDSDILRVCHESIMMLTSIIHPKRLVTYTESTMTGVNIEQLGETGDELSCIHDKTNQEQLLNHTEIQMTDECNGDETALSNNLTTEVNAAAEFEKSSEEPNHEQPKEANCNSSVDDNDSSDSYESTVPEVITLDENDNDSTSTEEIVEKSLKRKREPDDNILTAEKRFQEDVNGDEILSNFCDLLADFVETPASQNNKSN